MLLSSTTSRFRGSPVAIGLIFVASNIGSSSNSMGLNITGQQRRFWKMRNEIKHFGPWAMGILRIPYFVQLTRVVIATRDPDPRVDGAGIAKLEAAGIRVEEGVLEEAAV